MAMKISGKDGFYGWVNLGVMFIFNLILFCFVMNMFGFCLSIWEEQFGWSRGAIAFAQTISLILTGFAAPFAGIFLMKHGARKAMVLGNILTAVALFLIAFQTHLWQLYLCGGILMGLGMSFGGMLAMMTITNNWFIMKRSIAMSITMASMGLNIVLGPFLMSLINDKDIGWRQSFMIVAALVLVFCALIPGLLIKNKPEDIGQTPDGPSLTNMKGITPEASRYKEVYKTPVDFTAKEALRTRTLWLITIYGMLQFFCLNALMMHQVAFLRDLQFSPGTAAIAAGILTAVTSISSLGIGFLGLKINMRFLAIASVIIGLVGFGTIIAANITVKSLPLVMTYCVILGIGFGIQGIAMGNLIPDYFGRSEFPRIMGFTTPVTTIGSSLGGPIAGFIHDWTHSYLGAFIICIAMMSICLICMIFAKPPVHPSLQKGGALGAIGD
jgi:MFS family permease